MSRLVHLRLVIDNSRRLSRRKRRQKLQSHTADVPPVGPRNNVGPVPRRDAVPPKPLMDDAVLNAGVFGESASRSPSAYHVSEAGKGNHADTVRYVLDNVKTICTAGSNTLCAMDFSAAERRVAANLTTRHERLRWVSDRWARKHDMPHAKNVADRFGWNVNTFRSHRNGTRDYSDDDAKRYAVAFGVNDVWLLTGTDPKIDLSPDEAVIINTFRTLDPEQQGQALRILTALAAPDTDPKKAVS